MAFRVRKWPSSPDPRGPDFNFPGWDFGENPPWSWIMSTTNATGIYAIFNGGVILKPTDLNLFDTVFENVDPLPDDLTVLMSSKGSQLPLGPPPGITKSIGLIISVLAVEAFAGGKEWLYPTAIEVRSGIDMIPDSPPGGTFPDPATLTPAKWNE